MAKTKTKKTKAIVKAPEQKPEVPEFAFTIVDKVFGELKVKHTYQAWYADRGKVEALLNAFKYDCTYEEACVSAGISLDQLKYFIEQHEELSTVIALCREVPSLKARQHVVGALGTDLTTSRWYLERKKAGEFAPKPPVVAVQINMAERMQAKKTKFSEVSVKTSIESAPQHA